jgi:hypothetical protein
LGVSNVDRLAHRASGSLTRGSASQSIHATWLCLTLAASIAFMSGWTVSSASVPSPVARLQQTEHIVPGAAAEHGDWITAPRSAPLNRLGAFPMLYKGFTVPSPGFEPGRGRGPSGV